MAEFYFNPIDRQYRGTKNKERGKRTGRKSTHNDGSEDSSLEPTWKLCGVASDGDDRNAESVIEREVVLLRGGGLGECEGGLCNELIRSQGR